MKAQLPFVSISEFARALLDRDRSFADRVHPFEKQFGEPDADTLAVLAQAASFCWFEYDYEADLVAICRAIREAKPVPFYSCRQVTPGRWLEMNTYVVGVQRWLGLDLPTPQGVDSAKTAQIRRWLGERTAAKEALVALFLSRHIGQLLDTSLAMMGEGASRAGADYADFAPLYVHADGNRACEPWYVMLDADRYPPRHDDAYIQECKRIVRREMAHAPEDAEELITGILRASQPPCMHRYSRYQDIQLASIGALEWRRDLPTDDGSKQRWHAFMAEATTGLQAWLDGAEPRGDLALRLHNALGALTRRGGPR